MSTGHTDVTVLDVDGYDRKMDFLRAEVWRTVSSVGNFVVTLRNVDDKYNSVFDIQDVVEIWVDPPWIAGAGIKIFEGPIDGPGVTRGAQDIEDIFEELVTLKGVDMAQDLLFHNDYDNFYPDVTQTLNLVLNDVFNVGLFGLTNINYTPFGGTPVVGAAEFREGTSFLASLQELHRRAGYVFYVDDNLNFYPLVPGTHHSGQTLTCVAGGADNNILGIIDYNTRNGDKLYNYIKLYGKNPQFDAWTEYNAANWTGVACVVTDAIHTPTPIVGEYCVKGFAINPAGANPALRLDFTGTNFNYATLDLSKGEIGAWVYYHGATSSAYNKVRVYVRDSASQSMFYSGNKTRIARDEWGWVTAPLGEDIGEGGGVGDNNSWFPLRANFDWEHVDMIWFLVLETAPDYPEYIAVDGLTLPVPPIAIAENIPSQTAYRRRPYIDTYSHIRTQNSLDEAALQMLAQHKDSDINYLKLMTHGNPYLRYAGYRVSVNIPDMGVNNQYFYMTTIHHIIQPYFDVTDGYGFDYVTEVELVPKEGVAYDMNRLRTGPMVSAYQRSTRDGMGLRVK